MMLFLAPWVDEAPDHGRRAGSSGSQRTRQDDGSVPPPRSAARLDERSMLLPAGMGNRSHHQYEVVHVGEAVHSIAARLGRMACMASHQPENRANL